MYSRVPLYRSLTSTTDRRRRIELCVELTSPFRPPLVVFCSRKQNSHVDPKTHFRIFGVVSLNVNKKRWVSYLSQIRKDQSKSNCSGPRDVIGFLPTRDETRVARIKRNYLGKGFSRRLKRGPRKTVDVLVGLVKGEWGVPRGDEDPHRGRCEGTSETDVRQVRRTLHSRVILSGVQN